MAPIAEGDTVRSTENAVGLDVVVLVEDMAFAGTVAIHAADALCDVP